MPIEPGSAATIIGSIFGVGGIGYGFALWIRKLLDQPSDILQSQVDQLRKEVDQAKEDEKALRDNYEKKLEDQKTFYEAKLREQKKEYDKKLSKLEDEIKELRDIILSIKKDA
jgi:predicted  nucleic acid-binding Zn-ribbon protein